MQARILEIGSLLKAGKESGKTINADRRGELLAEQAALTVQSQLLRQELAGNNCCRDLGKSQHDLAHREDLAPGKTPRPAGADQREAPRAVGKDRRRAVQGAQGAGTDSLLSQENAKNLRLSDYLLRVPPTASTCSPGATSRPSSNWTT